MCHQENGWQMFSSCYFLSLAHHLFATYHIRYYHIWISTFKYPWHSFQSRNFFCSLPFLMKRWKKACKISSPFSWWQQCTYSMAITSHQSPPEGPGAGWRATTCKHCHDFHPFSCLSPFFLLHLVPPPLHTFIQTITYSFHFSHHMIYPLS